MDAIPGRPDEARDVEPTLQVQTARQRWLSASITLCWAAFFLSNLARGRSITTTVDLVAAVLTAALWLWARANPARRVVLAGHLTLVVGSLALCAAAAVGGLSRSVALWYVGGVPLVAGYAMSTRAAVAWTAASAVMVAGVLGLEQLAPPPQEFLPDETELTVGRVLFFMLLGAFAVASRRAADLHVSLLQQQKQLTQQRAQELAVARDEALQAARAKSAFLAAMSHEIRTPLNAVVGLAELLERTPLPPDERRMVGTIENAGKSLVRIVNDVLQFSKLEAGGARPVPAAFDLRACVEDVRALLAPLATERHLELATAVDAAVPRWVMGDGHVLRQVLVNLVSNGIKYTDAGSVTLRVTGTAPQLVFTVEDTGIGMEPAQLEQLFQPFSQLGQDGPRQRGGTGLGLAISKRLLDLLGGSVEVHSRPGGGSTFTVRLALETAAPPATGPVAVTRPAVTRRVLLAEDNAGNQLVLTRMLEVLGCQVEVAESGQQALEKATLGSFDLVFMDMHMPEMDGLEATRRVCAALPRERRPWIVGLTASSGEDQRQACLAAGMDDFVTKPVDLRTLQEAMARARPPRTGSGSLDVQPAGAGAAPSP